MTGASPGDCAKICASKGSAGYIADQSLTEVLPVAFVGDKEKGLILLDGPAQSSSELIQVKGRLVRRIQGIDRIGGIENVVAQEVVGFPMERFVPEAEATAQLAPSCPPSLRRRQHGIDADISLMVSIGIAART